MISKGDWLNDNVISGYQQLLKKQKPVSGLQDTILGQSLQFSVESKEFVQVLHVFGSHWVAISTVGCEKGEVNWFDSLHCKPSSAAEKMIADLVQYPGKKLQVLVCNVQKQMGYNDCGIFALAFVTAVAFGIDPCSLYFKQELMRPHLIHV